MGLAPIGCAYVYLPEFSRNNISNSTALDAVAELSVGINTEKAHRCDRRIGTGDFQYEEEQVAKPPSEQGLTMVIENTKGRRGSPRELPCHFKVLLNDSVLVCR